MTGPRPYLILRIVGLVVWVLSVVRVWVEVRLFWRRTLVLLRGVLLPLMPVRSLLLGRHSVVLLLRHLPALETGGHVTFDNSRVAPAVLLLLLLPLQVLRACHLKSTIQQAHIQHRACVWEWLWYLLGRLGVLRSRQRDGRSGRCAGRGGQRDGRPRQWRAAQSLLCWLSRRWRRGRWWQAWDSILHTQCLSCSRRTPSLTRQGVWASLGWRRCHLFIRAEMMWMDCESA